MSCARRERRTGLRSADEQLRKSDGGHQTRPRDRAWKQPGDITSVPRLENGNPDQVQTQSTRFLTDASFVALRNVNLSYSFDQSVLDRLGLNNLSLFVSGENLWFNSARQGLNPQYNLAGTGSGNDYRPNSILSLGLNVGF